jgi:septal ring factor EnvC (AmiA/AmiB activator)
VTNSEEIRKLANTVATLEERLDNTRAELKRVDAERSKSADILIEFGRKQAVLEENVKELKKVAEESGRRRFTLLMAAIGCLLTLAANIILTYLRWGK